MIDGEGSSEISAEIATPNPLLEFLQDSNRSDASASPSQYSSCGESDDAERYCSANSAMGTPSLCSSFGAFSECLDFELGTSRSFGPGEIRGLENLGLGGRVIRIHKDHRVSSSDGLNSLRNHRAESCEGQTDSTTEVSADFFDNVFPLTTDDAALPDGSNTHRPRASGTNLGEPLYRGNNENIVLWSGLVGGAVLQNATQTAYSNESMSSGNLQRVAKAQPNPSFEEHRHKRMGGKQIQCGFDELNSKSGFQLDEMESFGLSAEDEASSVSEHSEGEDSMYGADNEHVYGLLGVSIEHGQDAKKTNYGNLLTMNSSTAFGSQDWDDFMLESGDATLYSAMLNNYHEQKKEDLEVKKDAFSSLTTNGSEKREDAIDILSPRNPVKCINDTKVLTKNCSKTDVSYSMKSEDESVGNYPLSTDQLGGTEDFGENVECCNVSDTSKRKKDLLKQEVSRNSCLNIMIGESRPSNAEEIIGIDNGQSIELASESDPLSKSILDHNLPMAKVPDHDRLGIIQNEKPNPCPLTTENNVHKKSTNLYDPADMLSEHPVPSKKEDLELNPFYDELVHDMEDILLEAYESSGVRSSQQGGMKFRSRLSMPSRDGGSTASTSGTDDTNLVRQSSRVIDGIELVGAKQRKGDVSLSERLVGVKEYTVYKIRVWSGNNEWEVERRYRDFFTLYRRLKSFYADQGWVLPSPWSSVERGSGKMFGSASPDIIALRSAIIQDCLLSILHSRDSSWLPSAFILFLSPHESPSDSPASEAMPLTSFAHGGGGETFAAYGYTISLIVEIRPRKTKKQILEAQHYTCAGCRRSFDDGSTRLHEFVQKFGLKKPRLCEYTGQLFCSSCHTNDTAVLPARVLHHWDFSQCPVSQLAKSYLDSIHDQPMLCVSAVNPFLFSKVPPLLHVMGVRKKVAAMLPNVRCPFRRSIYKGLGHRSYLLESNDFFALRDLIDLSKGPFAALPLMIETLSRKILEHIMERCLICCDVGVPCAARQACADPPSLIFPFQEGEVDKCDSCASVFHKACFKLLKKCPCGAHLNVDEAIGHTSGLRHNINTDVIGSPELTERREDPRSSAGFLSGLFSKAIQEKLWGPKKGDNVILMGSLPNTCL